MKLLIILYPLVSCHFLPLRSKSSPQQPVLKHPQTMVLPTSSSLDSNFILTLCFQTPVIYVPSSKQQTMSLIHACTHVCTHTRW